LVWSDHLLSKILRATVRSARVALAMAARFRCWPGQTGERGECKIAVNERRIGDGGLTS
jgi:hypothetical protein